MVSSHRVTKGRKTAVRPPATDILDVNLLSFVLSNCTWDDGEVVATFRQPFDLLAETTAIASRSGGNDGGNSAKSEIWLGDLDSNQGCAGQSREFYR